MEYGDERIREALLRWRDRDFQPESGMDVAVDVGETSIVVASLIGQRVRLVFADRQGRYADITGHCIPVLTAGV